MTEATKFKSWQKMGEPAAPYVTKSPNLVQIHAYCRDTWKMTNLGISVPPGFTITTEACVEYYKLGKKYAEAVTIP